MKPPFKVIKIDGHPDLNVEWDAKLGRLPEGYPKGGDYGRNIVRLAGGQTQRSLKVTVIHELIHRLWEVTDLGRWLSVRSEELVVDSLAPWLVDTLRRNPALVEWLLAED